MGPIVSNALKNNLELSGDQIFLKLSNPVEQHNIEQVQADFLNFIRDYFNIPQLQLDHEVNIEQATQKAYTPKEKFEEMVKKNPALGKLRDQLGLDTDY